MGLGLACLLGVGTLFLGPRGFGQVNWLALKPDWMLLSQARSADVWSAGEAADELARRHAAGKLRPRQLRDALDAFLTFAEADAPSVDREAWQTLAVAGWDAEPVSAELIDRYLRATLQNFYRVQPTIRETYLVHEPFPFPDSDRSLYPEAGTWAWHIPGLPVGMAAYLERATLDGQTVELTETWHGKAWDGPREGWVGWWIPLNGSVPTLLPKPVMELPALSPGVGHHTLELTWRIEAFLLTESESAADAHPYREPDSSWTTGTSASFEVIDSMDDIVSIFRAKDPGAPPPPEYEGPDEGLTLRVESVRKLHRDGDWYVFVAGKLNRKPPPPGANYAVLARVHLEIDGVPYRVAEWQGASDVFFDRTNAPPVGQGSAVRPRMGFRLNIIDLPRADYADLVLTPAPELFIRQPWSFGIEPVWGDPIIIRDVPIDWSGVPPTPPGTEPTPADD
ncbi:MAG: hypothetical protein HND58_15390 [Planctomycetota bacterium]|nr:MAG: hypothetical protein HND58_15390 [Planctomycetota bacterium]